MNINALSMSLCGGQVALIISETNRLYFTEFQSSDGFLLVSKNGAIFITDSRYIEAAQTSAKDCKVLLQKPGKDFYAQLAQCVKTLGGKTVLIEASRLSVAEADFYEKLFLENKIKTNKTSKLDKTISEFRIVKTDEEIAKIQKAQRIAEKAFKKVLPMVKPGVKEAELAAALDYEMRLGGAECVSFETIVATGKNSSMPHAVPGATKVKSGDFITFDFGAVYDGYHSDTTRTIAVGSITPKMANIYDIVLRAQKCGVAAISPAVTNRAVDKACRDIIKGAGYGDYFGHSTGHGVGVEIHEPPTLYCRAKKEILLKPGMVVTVEPGIYLPGEFGVRIEDMLAVTSTGAKNFVSLPKKLITL